MRNVKGKARISSFRQHKPSTQKPAAKHLVLNTKRPVRNNQIRIGTLGWSVIDRDLPELSPQQLLDSLNSAKPEPDLILCAGLYMDHLPSIKDVMKATGGTPVLLEDVNGEWHLFQGNRAPVVRHVQEFANWNQVRRKGRALKRRLANNEGAIRVPGWRATLQLLICGENNILNTATNNHSSVLKGGLLANGAPYIFQANWILLNPVHLPYRTRTRSAGAAKVIDVDRNPGTLKRLTDPGHTYRDGTRAPHAVVYANNFVSQDDWTAQVAGLVFYMGRKRQRSHQEITTFPEGLCCIYREFLVPDSPPL